MAVIRGMSICDLLVAKTALDRAQEAGVGSEIPTTLQESSKVAGGTK